MNASNTVPTNRTRTVDPHVDPHIEQEGSLR